MNNLWLGYFYYNNAYMERERERERALKTMDYSWPPKTYIHTFAALKITIHPLQLSDHQMFKSRHPHLCNPN